MRLTRTHLAATAAAGALYLWLRRRRKSQLPVCVVDGCDVYVVDAADADAVVEHVANDVLGVDVEWPPTAKPRCAVVQIAARDACVVIRVGAATRLPPRTTLLLRRAICVGVGIREDCHLILRDLGCACGRKVDLRSVADRREAGLASLAAAFAPTASLPHKSDKSVRQSDWAGPLSRAQIEYAAGDAIASYRVGAGLWAASGASTPLVAWLRALPTVAPAPAKPRRARVGPSSEPSARDLHKRARRRRYEAWHAEHAKSHHYDNIPLVAKSGRLLGLVAQGKADWYCDRGLAARDADGRVVLDYEPDIVDEDRCLQIPRKNECVGCGATSALTRFYVVPYRFRRCFPEAFKQHASHNVVALCLKCRDVVDPAYHERSQALEASIGPSPAPAVNSEAEARLRAIGAAKTLVRGTGIPEARRDYLRAIVAAAYPGRQVEDVAALPHPPKVRVKVTVDGDSLEARYVRRLTREAGADLAGRLHAFEAAWRRCFVGAVRPTHLPQGWTVEHTIVPRARPPPESLVCRAHLKGRCVWGGACKYRHDEDV